MHDYHDATLKSANLEWESGTTTMTFMLSAEPAREATVVMRETVDLKCERQSPWGKSISVNRVDIQKLDSGYRLVLEMQSGDRIIVLGNEVVERTDDPTSARDD